MNKLDKTYTATADSIFDKMYEDFCVEFHKNKMELYYSMTIRIQALKEADPISQQEFLKDLAISN
jgi:hypothetical protein